MTLDFGMPENGNVAAAIRAAVTARNSCDVCHDSGTIQFEEGALPCPYCRPAAAREAASGPVAVKS